MYRSSILTISLIGLLTLGCLPTAQPRCQNFRAATASSVESHALFSPLGARDQRPRFRGGDTACHLFSPRFGVTGEG